MVLSAPMSLLLIPRGRRNSLLVGEERRPRGCPRPHRHRLWSKQRSESGGTAEMCRFFPLRLASMGTDGGYSRLKGPTMLGNGLGSFAVLSPLTSCVSSTRGLSWGDQDGQRCGDLSVAIIIMFHQFVFSLPLKFILFLQHPQSPISTDPRFALGGGRLFEMDGKLYRWAKDGDALGRGSRLHLLRIDALSDVEYWQSYQSSLQLNDAPLMGCDESGEALVTRSPLGEARTWSAANHLHHVDIQQLWEKNGSSSWYGLVEHRTCRQHISGDRPPGFNSGSHSMGEAAKTQNIILHVVVAQLLLSVVIFAAWRFSGHVPFPGLPAFMIRLGEGLARKLLGLMKKMLSGGSRRSYQQTQDPCPGHIQGDGFNDDDKAGGEGPVGRSGSGTGVVGCDGERCWSTREGVFHGGLGASSVVPELMVATLALISMLIAVLVFFAAPSAVPCSRWNVRVDVTRSLPARHHDDASSPFDVSDLVIITGTLYFY